jgi:uncharacterized protein (TIGR02246 family)
MSVAIRVPDSIQELADRYLQAWNDHDLETLVGLHTSDTQFHINGVGGAKSAVGLEACREMFDYLLRAWPDQHFEVQSLTIRDDWDDFWIVHWVCTATLALPWEMGDKTFEPAGQRVSFGGNDMMTCRGNRIASKDSWIDGLAIARQLEPAM